MIKVRLYKAGKLIILAVCQGQDSLLTMAEKGSDLAIRTLLYLFVIGLAMVAQIGRV